MPKINRALQKGITRQHLIETAFAEFAKKGLLLSSTADLARIAGVAHGTIFAHFPTREELLVAVIQEFGDRMTRRIHELVGEGSRARGGLKEVLEAHLEGLKEYEPFYIRLITEENLLPGEARNTLVMIQSAISFHIIQSAAREVNSGKIRALPFHLLFNQWVGLIHYYLMNSEYFAPGESVLVRHGTELLDYYLSLIQTKKEVH